MDKERMKLEFSMADLSCDCVGEFEDDP
jgi:hypothetical protein